MPYKVLLSIIKEICCHPTKVLVSQAVFPFHPARSNSCWWANHNDKKHRCLAKLSDPKVIFPSHSSMLGRRNAQSDWTWPRGGTESALLNLLSKCWLISAAIFEICCCMLPVAPICCYLLISLSICCHLLLLAAVGCYLLLVAAMCCHLLLLAALCCYLLLSPAVCCPLLLSNTSS